MPQNIWTSLVNNEWYAAWFRSGTWFRCLNNSLISDQLVMLELNPIDGVAGLKIKGSSLKSISSPRITVCIPKGSFEFFCAFPLTAPLIFDQLLGKKTKESEINAACFLVALGLWYYLSASSISLCGMEPYTLARSNYKTTRSPFPSLASLRSCVTPVCSIQ